MATQAIHRPFTNNRYSTVQMAAVTETSQRPSMLADCSDDHLTSRIIPIPTPKIQMTAPSPGEPMDISSPTKPFAKMASTSPTTSAPASGNAMNTNANAHASPNGNVSPTSANDAASANGTNQATTPTPSEKKQISQADVQPSMSSMPAPPAAAAAAVHQPKIVQTAFIHKLYNMLEDQSIQHLISWSPSAESFVMSPTADFSKVLAQYFKHTNISSFVRQLNMYGFHKVSDVFHTGNPETALWEFKHGNGNFKRGDLISLREIKRRASKHALVHREFNSQKPSPLQPGAPAEPMPMTSDSGDPRLVEHSIYEINMRLQRSEEHAHFMHVRQQTVMDMLGKAMQLNQELARALLTLVPGPEHPVHRDVVALQGEFQRQSEVLRAMDEPQEHFMNSRQYFTNIENPPVSPRQLAHDDPRRSTLAVPQPNRSNNFYRPPVPSNLAVTPRRPFGSFGANSAQTSPSSVRPPPPPPPGPPGPHPLSHVEPPPGHLARRHTAADIRAHGWQGQPNHNPYAAGPGGPPPPPVGQWPPSPNRVAPEDQRIRDSFSSYSIQSASQTRPHSRPTTPPPPFANGAPGADTFGSWSFNSAGSRENKNLSVRDSSGPPTRRGSMAHILNPADTAEREGEDEDPRGDDDRKRKRVQ